MKDGRDMMRFVERGKGDGINVCDRRSRMVVVEVAISVLLV